MPIALWIILIALLALIAVMLVRTFAFARPFEPAAPVEAIPVDTDAVAEHLSQAVRCKTTSVDAETPPTGECLTEFRHKLEDMYPLVHAHLERRLINEHALLYTWPGTNPDLRPILLIAHQDVVPVDPATLSEWEYPPFEGQIADGYVWGRGTLDDKNQLIAMLEAVEALLGVGYVPQRTIHLGFGHDEEIGGRRGAAQIAAWLGERDVQIEALLDEGGTLLEGLLPGVRGQVALVGTAEKGYATLDLSVVREPGHSAMPPKQTAIGILARAVARLENHPMRARTGPMRAMMQGIGTAAPFLYRLAFANLWLFGPLVRRALDALPQTSAMMRTTTAATVIAGGIKENVLPGEARAKVNYRLLTGDRTEDVIAHARQVIGDKRVEVRLAQGFRSEPSPVSPADGPAFRRLALAIRQTFGHIPVAPFLVIYGLDARHYGDVCKNTYRFAPSQMTAQDLKRLHGTNERIGVDDLARMVQFYGQLIKVWAGDGQKDRRSSA
jgi:carboxypeptidase PM20D1